MNPQGVSTNARAWPRAHARLGRLRAAFGEQW